MAEELEGFDALMAALKIFRKYGNSFRPFHCEHDELTVCVDPSKVSAADKQKLDELGFFSDGYYFKSYRFGSA